MIGTALWRAAGAASGAAASTGTAVRAGAALRRADLAQLLRKCQAEYYWHSGNISGCAVPADMRELNDLQSDGKGCPAVLRVTESNGTGRRSCGLLVTLPLSPTETSRLFWC